MPSEVQKTKRVSPAPRMALDENDVQGVEQAVDGHEPQQHHDQIPQGANCAGSMPAAWPMRNQSGTNR